MVLGISISILQKTEKSEDTNWSIFHLMTFTEVKTDLMDAIDINDYKSITQCQFRIDAGATKGVA